MPAREISKDLAQTLRQLKLGKTLPTLPEHLRCARERQMDPEDVLLVILNEETDRRARQRVAMRAEKAGLDAELVFDVWDQGANVTYDRHLLDDLRLLKFVERKENVLLLGPVGVGKTMIAHALGHLAVARGWSVGCERADRLFKRLKGARLDSSHSAEIRRLANLDVLIVDDFALKALDSMETSDLYEIVMERHRKSSIILTSNRDPSEWIPMLGDPLNAQAILDRLLNNAHDLVIEGESYRKHQKPARAR